MQLGRVIGTVVATAKVDGLEGVKLLLVQPLTKHLEPKGEVIVAADGVAMAGEGELVYYVSSREASLALPQTFVPVDDAIVGLVDEIALHGEDRR
ncbi:MAG: EutN/CcmL family microcompartment protein [Acidobacteriota bacterium]|nr:EutN/CcmL family microcompartment protein [Acidobacteriota bacterium]